MNKCPRCSEDLDSLIESDLQMCFACLRNFVRDSNEQKIKLESSISKIEILEKESREDKKKLSRVKELLDAERSGVNAGKSKLKADQNPFLTDEELSYMWEGGRTIGVILGTSSRNKAITQWAVETLEHVVELSKGYSQKEIATKIEFVKDKLVELLQQYEE